MHEKTKHACSVLPWNDFIVSVETKANNTTQVDVLKTNTSHYTSETTNLKRALQQNIQLYNWINNITMKIKVCHTMVHCSFGGIINSV